MIVTCCGPSLLKIVVIVSSTSAPLARIMLVVPTKRVPSGSRTATWKTGASAWPMLATLMVKGTLARCCTGSRTTVVLGTRTLVIVRSGSTGVDVKVGVMVVVGVTPATVGASVLVGRGWASLVCVA